MSTKKERYCFGTIDAVLQRTESPVEEHDLAWYIEQVTHPLEGLDRKSLVQVIAYLAAQWHGLNESLNKDVFHAMYQIGRIVHDYEARAEGKS